MEHIMVLISHPPLHVSLFEPLSQAKTLHRLEREKWLSVTEQESDEDSEEEKDLQKEIKKWKQRAVALESDLTAEKEVRPNPYPNPHPQPLPITVTPTNANPDPNPLVQRGSP